MVWNKTQVFLQNGRPHKTLLCFNFPVKLLYYSFLSTISNATLESGNVFADPSLLFCHKLCPSSHHWINMPLLLLSHVLTANAVIFPTRSAWMKPITPTSNQFDIQFPATCWVLTDTLICGQYDKCNPAIQFSFSMFDVIVTNLDLNELFYLGQILMKCAIDLCDFILKIAERTY